MQRLKAIPQLLYPDVVAAFTGFKFWHLLAGQQTKAPAGAIRG
jgi:hypothetical protein